MHVQTIELISETIKRHSSLEIACFALALWQNDIREHTWLLNLIALAALGLIVSGSSLPCWVNVDPGL